MDLPSPIVNIVLDGAIGFIIGIQQSPNLGAIVPVATFLLVWTTASVAALHHYSNQSNKR